MVAHLLFAKGAAAFAGRRLPGIWLGVLLVWVALLGTDPANDRTALFGLVIGLQALFAWLGLYVWTGGPIAIGFFVFGLIFMPLIVRFVVAAPLGMLISPLQSIRVMARDAVFAILFPLAAMLPLMAVHYALGIGAIFVAGDATKWVMLGLDSVVTAWLALVMICAQYVIATRPAPLPGAPQRQRAAAGTIAE